MGPRGAVQLCAALLCRRALGLAALDTGVKRVVLVRHGAVDRAAGGVRPDAHYGGDIDVPLSARGEAEARAAAAYVADTYGDSVTKIFASPMKRAVYGAERTAAAIGASGAVELRESFREVKRGDWLNKTPDEIAAEYGPSGDMDAFLGDQDFRPPNGESVNDVKARAAACLREDVLPSIAYGESAVVVSHIYVTRSLLSLGLDRPVADIPVPTASVSVLEFPAGGGPPAVASLGVKPPLDPADDAALAAGEAEA